MSANETIPIPGPPPLPILGNLLDLDRENTIQSWVELAGEYGPIYKLRLGGNDRIFVTGHELVDELCSRKDFVKIPVGIIRAQREVTPEGLFTAEPGQESWGLAHRVLTPAFGHLSVRNMFAEMHDVITQMILKWARYGEESPIDASSDFTRLTLDTIALCSMGTRFNSFHQETLHPFVKAMTDTLAESQQRSIRPAWLSNLFWKANREYSDNNKLLHEISAEVISNRRKNPSKRKDLVDAMLNGQDPVTGEGLSDEIIMDNMITFLIAGHETTSGLLAFVFGLLMLHQEAYASLQQEVDDVLGTGPMLPEHINQLPYTKACLREALRLYPPAAGFSVSPAGESPVLLGGKWLIKPEDSCIILLPKLHRDPEIFGDDADKFRPERMLEENFKKLPPNCYKPFGNGMRACIGSEFAMQEAIMATAMCIQRFEFQLKDPDWEMKIKQTATLRPRDLSMFAKLRRGVDVTSLQRDLFHSPTTDLRRSHHRQADPVHSGDSLEQMLVLYGSNTGTCQELAERLSMSASQKGYRCDIKSLDDATNSLPTDQPVVIITSSHYEGQPPDNATKFVSWLSNLDGKLSGVSYAVFGCGNKNWYETYQATPTTVDVAMKHHGARQLAARGETDANEGNIMSDFDAWQDGQLWPALLAAYGTKKSKSGETATTVLKQSAHAAKQSISLDSTTLAKAMQARVKEVKVLTTNEPRPKHHLSLELPEGHSYEVGDYLNVWPPNTTEDIEMLVQLAKGQGYESSDPLVQALCSRSELSQPASIKQLESLALVCADKGHKTGLEHIIQVSVGQQKMRRPSIVRLLLAFPSISLSLEQLATMLSPIRPRPYSIASSPLGASHKCELVWSLMSSETSWSDNPKDGSTAGLASHHMANLKPGDTLACNVRPGHNRFRPPTDLTTPVIMICAGSGIAPFLGFVAHREEQVRQNPELAKSLGPALLFVGCRSRAHAPYAAELERSKVVHVRYAYSKEHAEGEFGGYVQSRVWADRDELAQLWDRGARVYVCGNQGLSLGVKEVVRRIYSDAASTRCGGKTEEKVDAWWAKILGDRYAADIF